MINRSTFFEVTALGGRHVLIVFLLFYAISGCSSSSPTVVDSREEAPAEVVLWSDIETLDITSYPDKPIEKNRSVEHEVPSRLMNSTADDGLVQTLDGYRIQVFSSAVRGESVQKEEEVRQWLLGLSDQRRRVLGIEQRPAIYSFYKQPYYRVRIGDFTSRSRAQPVLNALRAAFPGALIVPDVIQVER